MIFPSISQIKITGIKAHKKKGQNFLIDQNLAYKTVESAEITSTDKVIEIGAGPGSLTFFLAKKNAHTTCIEIDPFLFNILSTSLCDNPNMIIVNNDILKIDISRFSSRSRGKIIIIGSIPYSITSPILLNIFRSCSVIKRAVLIVQKEVAKRLCAPSGNRQYGIFSIYCNAYMTTTELFTIPSASFYPKPKVDSTVILMQPVAGKNWDEEKEVFFRQILRTSFSCRRKMLSNCLKNFIYKKKINPDLFREKCTAQDIDLNSRAEALTANDFYRLAETIKGCIHG